MTSVNTVQTNESVVPIDLDESTPSVKYHWPEGFENDFGKKIAMARHNAQETSHFSDEALAALLDAYPRERLGIYRFPEQAEGPCKAEHGCAPTLSGAELIAAVKAGKIWLNLRAVNQEVPAYAKIAEALFGDLEKASGSKVLKKDMGVLISSPNIHVHYHLDIPMVVLVQVRGTKTVHLYPVGAPYAEPQQVEDITLRVQDEELNYKSEFDDQAHVITLEPGMAITWPQTAPHRVQNADMMNVSLSCEFMTAASILKANAIFANAKLRRAVGYSAPLPSHTGPVTVMKAVAAQAIKKVAPVPPKSPTPITFELLKDGRVKAIETKTVPALVVQEPSTAHHAAYECSVKRVSELTKADEAQWTELCDSDFQYGSPLLSPEFAKRVGNVRSDVRCILVRQDGKLVAVLAVHQRGFGHIRPVGAPFCDYSGPLIAAGANLTVQDIVTLAGYASFRSSSVVSRDAYHSNTKDDGSYIIRLQGQSSKDYLESRRMLHAKRFKNFRRLMSKLERDFGKIEFVCGAPDEADLGTLFKWKSQQFKREGLLDVISAKNSRSILDAFGTNGFDDKSKFGGFMTGLKINGRLITAHFGLRKGADFHPWISAYDPEFTDYGPGVLLLYRVIEEMGHMGLETYDLADGHSSYKNYFAEPERFVTDVVVNAPTLMGTMQSAGFNSWDYLGARNPASAAARLRRRLDHANVCESSWLARGKDIVTALHKRSRQPAMIEVPTQTLPQIPLVAAT